MGFDTGKVDVYMHRERLRGFAESGCFLCEDGCGIRFRREQGAVFLCRNRIWIAIMIPLYRDRLEIPHRG